MARDSMKVLVWCALAACRNDAAPHVVVSASALPTSASAAPVVVDELPEMGTDQATAERMLVAAGWSMTHHMAGTGLMAGPPGTAPVERDTSSLSATRAGWTLHATFDWSRLVLLTRTSPPLPDEPSVRAALAEIDKRLGARTWSQPDFGPDRDLAMWQTPKRIARASARHDATGWRLMESWSLPGH